MVIDWKNKVEKSNQIDQSPWGKLKILNKRVAYHFTEIMARQSQPYYKQSLLRARQLSQNLWCQETNEIIQILNNLRKDFLLVREQLRLMGELASDSVTSFIEPPEQTELANLTMNIKGVLIAGVPGAGGKDAIFAILINADKSVRDEVEEAWAKRNVCPLYLTEDNGGILVHETSSIMPTSKL